MDEIVIVITSIPLQDNDEEVFGMARKDESLIRAIKEHEQELLNDGVIIFERKDNILKTELGYRLSFFQSDLKLI